jgi:cysteine desulfurase / selenocysteine lyase
VGESSGRVALNALAPKSDFLGLDGVVHLAAGGETPFLRRHEEAFRRYAQLKGQGKRGLAQITAHADEARARVAMMLGVDADDVGFSYNVSQASNMVARVMASGPAGNVVMQRWEYPSMMYPWLRLRDAGWDIRLLSNPASLMDYRQLAALVDEKTAAIVVSDVSYLTGERVDLARLRAIADSVGAMLIVDASHSLGVVETDWSLADFVFCCCYKWLLGSHGVSIAYRNRERLPAWMPLEVGWANVEWQDAADRGAPVVPLTTGRMFELGITGLLAAMILGSALEYLGQFSLGAIESHVLELSGRLLTGLQACGMELMTPSAPAYRAGNVAFEVDDQDAWRESLEDAGVLTWTSDNRVRLSTFIYNDDADVDAALNAVEHARATLGQRRSTISRPTINTS